MVIYSRIVGRCPAMLMFETGQSRRFDRLPFTSSLPPSTDIVGARRHIANLHKREDIQRLNKSVYGPTLASRAPRVYVRHKPGRVFDVSFDDGGSAREQGWRHDKPERLCRL